MQKAYFITRLHLMPRSMRECTPVSFYYVQKQGEKKETIIY